MPLSNQTYALLVSVCDPSYVCAVMYLDGNTIVDVFTLGSAEERPLRVLPAMFYGSAAMAAMGFSQGSAYAAHNSPGRFGVIESRAAGRRS